MKKLFLPTLAALVLLVSFFYTSCKKTTSHPTYPTPANNRIKSYSKFTNTPLQRPVNENFTFFYDGQQRVIQILYTTNDSVKVYNGVSNLSITFTYSNDTIYKTTTVVHTAIVVEQDTLLQNSSGFITAAYTPGNFNTFTYFGKLIASNSLSTYDSGTTISAVSTYTSDNGDLLNHVYDGSLQATFPDSGLSFNTFIHDTDLSLPLNVTWTIYGPTWTTVTHTGVNSYGDELTGNTGGYPVSIEAVDPYGVVAYDTVFWHGSLYPKESYFVYPTLTNRPGDYLQIESFTKYGFNIYQNAHLIKQIVDQNGPITNISYTIDANSKITQTYVTGVAYADTIIYKFQYETD